MLRWLSYISSFPKELLVMRCRKYDGEARIVFAIYASQVIVFALGALYAL